MVCNCLPYSESESDDESGDDEEDVTNSRGGNESENNQGDVKFHFKQRCLVFQVWLLNDCMV